MTSESTRFLGQPNEIKPTVGAVGWGTLLTLLFYLKCDFGRVRALDQGVIQTFPCGVAGTDATRNAEREFVRRIRIDIAGIRLGGECPLNLVVTFWS